MSYIQWAKNSLSQGSSSICALALNSVWDVEAAGEYDHIFEVSFGYNRGIQKRSGQQLIAIRTFSGEGEMTLTNGKIFKCKKDTLFLCDMNELKRYRAFNDSWRKWWFEFTVFGANPFPLNRLVTIKPQPDANKQFDELFSRLRRGAFEEQSLASAMFNKFLYGWLAESDWSRERSEHQAVINEVIDLMYEKISDNLTVEQMAQAAYMSVTRFRSAFRESSGKSPKQFYDNLRMSMAEELLYQGNMNVEQVAYKLGYCDPYHFSKAFKKRYGFPPSELQKRTEKPESDSTPYCRFTD